MHTFGETGTGVPAFLAKLWRLVEDPETNNLIYWSKDGRSFIIQNQAQFARELLPLNYKHNNMASFIRQLNMYGFHKITSIDNGGLKFDRDEMEFSHIFFKRGSPHLLEHIKRKIANTKVLDEKAPLKPESVNKVLTEVKVMRGRQDSLDSRFSVMKQENEALWREIASLRQKHMKQQQIVNKLIQFLVTIVQPNRNVSGVKRHFQLMINDTPQNSKLRKHNDSESGPVIHELSEELLDEVNYDDTDLINSPSPKQLSSNEPTNVMISGIDSPAGNSERPQSNISASSHNYDHSNQSTEDALLQNAASPSFLINSNNLDGTPIVYHITEVPENAETPADSSGQFFDENVLNTPMVKKELARNQIRHQQQQNNQQQPQQQQHQQRKRKSQKTLNEKIPDFAASTSKNLKTDNNPLRIKIEKDLDSLLFLDDNEHGMDSDPSIDPTLVSPNHNVMGDQSEKEMYLTKDFITDDIPAELFEDSSILGDMSLASGSYNSNIDVKQKASTSSTSLNTTNKDNNDIASNAEKSLTLAKYNNQKFPVDDDIMRLSTAEDVNTHLDTVQDDLENLKDILRGDGYSIEPNTLMGSGNTPNRFYLSSPLDGDMLAKLFSDTDILAPYGLSLSNDANPDNRKGSEIMTYQPYYADLSDLIEANAISKTTGYDENNSESPEPPNSVLNTPQPQRE